MTVETSHPNRIYHGLAEVDDDNGHLIVAELGGGGPTQRDQTQRLYQLDNPHRFNGYRTFLWGYEGTNPRETAQVMLNDALGVDPPKMLRQAFTTDFVAHWHEDQEWWLPRRTILRWVKGWCAEHRIDIPPGDAATIGHRAE